MIYMPLVNEPKIILCACVMSIPTSLFLSKLRYPEDSVPVTKGCTELPDKLDKECNFLHAATNGSAQGIQLALLVGASLVSIVSLYGAADYFVGWFFGMLRLYQHKQGENIPIKIEYLLGYLFFPFAWLIGVPVSECFEAGQLLAVKMVINEIVAYTNLKAITDASIIGARL